MQMLLLLLLATPLVDWRTGGRDKGVSVYPHGDLLLRIAEQCEVTVCWIVIYKVRLVQVLIPSLQFSIIYGNCSHIWLISIYTMWLIKHGNLYSGAARRSRMRILRILQIVENHEFYEFKRKWHWQFFNTVLDN